MNLRRWQDVAFLPPPMAAFPKHLLTLLLLLAMSSAQVLGIGKGYLCHCGDQPVLSASADCESAGCHHDDEDRHDDEGEHSHEHEKVSEPLQGLTFVPLAPAPPVLREWVLPEWLQPVPTGNVAAHQHASSRPPPGPERAISASVTIAKASVRLI